MHPCPESLTEVALDTRRVVRALTAASDDAYQRCARSMELVAEAQRALLAASARLEQSRHVIAR